MSEERTELEIAEDKLIDHLNSKLASGKIGAIESKLLLDILARRQSENRVSKGKPALSDENLPFGNANRIVGDE
jgi:hypothetical protein